MSWNFKGKMPSLPDELTQAFLDFDERTKEQGIGLVCAVFLHLGNDFPKKFSISVHFAPGASENEHKDVMCKDLSKIFEELSRNFATANGKEKPQ